MRVIAIFISFMTAFAAVGENTGTASPVHTRIEQGERLKLYVTGETYSMMVNCTDAVIEKFTVGARELIGTVPLCPVINAGKVNGPGKVDITQSGPVLTEIHLNKLWWTDLKADIELALYCYPTHVVTTVNVIPQGTPPDFALGWYGGATFSMPLVMSSEEELRKHASFNGQNPECAVLVAEPWIQLGVPGRTLRTAVKYGNSTGTIMGSYGYRANFPGVRSATLILAGARSNDDLKDFIRGEAACSFARVTVQGGEFIRYDGSKGYFIVTQSTGADALDVSITLEPPRPPAPEPPALSRRAVMALAKITWPVGVLLFLMLAIVVFGFGSRPNPRLGRVPVVIAFVALVALVGAVVWLFRLPPPTRSGSLPMPHRAVPAVVLARGAPHETLTLQRTAPGAQLQSYAAGGRAEAIVAIALDPAATTSFRLTSGAAANGSVGAEARVH